MKPGLIDEQRAMLADWRALCDWLEAQPYNAHYEPRGRGAYLLCRPYSPLRTIRVRDETTPPSPVWGHLMKEVPNPNLADEIARSRRSRMITRERRRLGVVYWAQGFGWRLRKDYRERLEAEQARLDALVTDIVA